MLHCFRPACGTAPLPGPPFLAASSPGLLAPSFPPHAILSPRPRPTSHVCSAQGPVAQRRGLGGGPAQPSGLEGVAEYRREAQERAPRFFVPTGDFPRSEDSLGLIDEQEAAHALKALRLRVGSLVELCDGSGRLVKCAIEATSRAGCSVRAVEDPREEAWPGARLQLVVGMTDLQGSRADWLVEKAAELGAWSLRPLLSEHAGSPFKGKGMKKPKGNGDDEPGSGGAKSDRWRRVAQAANQQSLRSFGLILEDAYTVKDLCADIASADLALIAVGGAPPLCQVLSSPTTKSPNGAGASLGPGSRCLLIVGPPGDFSLGEAEAIAAAGALPVGLGDLRLRTETAAMSLLAGAGLLLH